MDTILYSEPHYVKLKILFRGFFPSIVAGICIDSTNYCKSNILHVKVYFWGIQIYILCLLIYIFLKKKIFMKYGLRFHKFLVLVSTIIS